MRGPIIIIDDDADDKDIFQDVLEELGVKNELVWFSNSDNAWQYLKNSGQQPFIIFSDVNLPLETGIEFKTRVDEDPELRRKCIPFVFYSTATEPEVINEAYTQITIQGFFKKHNSMAEMKNDIKLILDYWRLCKHPNSN